jgi:predicted alpha-1,6-mannanase (GH76 family)
MARFMVALAVASAAAVGAADSAADSATTLPSSTTADSAADSATTFPSSNTAAHLASLAQSGVTQLLSYYNPTQQWFGNNSQGLPFWETANSIETLANYMLLTGDLTPMPTIEAIFTASQTRYCPGPTWCFFDDMGWYVHAWMRMYELTGNSTYLTSAEFIFADIIIAKGWNTTCGAMRWAENSGYINAIPNELFLSASLKLERLTGSEVPVGGNTYSEWAELDWAWWASGPLFVPFGDGVLIADGLAPGPCSGPSSNATGPPWTYNQGVLLTGLAQLAVAHNNGTYAALGRTIAETAMTYFAYGNGTAGGSPVLVEKNCGPDGVCGGPDGRQFKGVFMRHLVYALPILASFAPDPAAVTEAYSAWILAQATSIEANASMQDLATGGTQYSNVWQGPFIADNTPWVSQGAGLDAILAALAVLQGR